MKVIFSKSQTIVILFMLKCLTLDPFSVYVGFSQNNDNQFKYNNESNWKHRWENYIFLNFRHLLKNENFSKSLRRCFRFNREKRFQKWKITFCTKSIHKMIKSNLIKRFGSDRSPHQWYLLKSRKYKTISVANFTYFLGITIVLKIWIKKEYLIY